MLKRIRIALTKELCVAVFEETGVIMDNDWVNLGIERAKTLARALNCHPAVLVFPGWEISLQDAA